MVKRKLKNPPNPPGIFIVFEGGEGSGKTTQINLLYEALQKRNYPVILTKEPGGTALGIALRSLLIDKTSAMSSNAELLLFTADRAQHVSEIISPAIRDGKIILSDRHSLSTYAYQGCGRGMSLALISRLNRIACGSVSPNLTIWLAINPSLGLLRARNRSIPDRMEIQNLKFHEAVYEGFAKAAEKNKSIVPVDASKPADEIHRVILSIIRGRLEILV